MLNLTEVSGSDGRVRHYEVEISLTSISRPAAPAPITWKTPLSLTVTNQGNHVLRLQGSASIKVIIPCARCLSDVETQIDISFDEEADMKLSDEERTRALDESIYLHGYELDTDQLVGGEVLLAWPSSVLCREDCRGLCDRCGQNLNLKTCNCDRTELDPRMAKILDLFESAGRTKE